MIVGRCAPRVTLDALIVLFKKEWSAEFIAEVKVVRVGVDSRCSWC
jgi:hypothetical protein